MVLMFLLLILLLGQILKLEGEISYIPVVMDINNKLGNEEGNHYLLDDISLGMPLSLLLPLCSLFQYQTPAMIKPLRMFYYSELQISTDGFSNLSVVAESELGVVFLVPCYLLIYQLFFALYKFNFFLMLF